MSDRIPNVSFGKEETTDIDWRKQDSSQFDIDDDEEIKTPDDVKAMLGFDVDELKDIDVGE